MAEEEVVDFENQVQAAEESRKDTEEKSGKSNFKHPVAVFFHFFFKIFALVAYLVLKWGIIYDNFVVSFVIVALALAADFWTVKNVTGRLLAGLRWWHYVKEDGSNVWVFESSNGKDRNMLEMILFWGGLVGVVLVWILFAVVVVLDFDWKYLFIIFVAIALTGANIGGYARCIKNKKGQIKDMATDYVTKAVIKQATSNI
eukprot:TRINITY_DN6526_c0_g1_i2.p1 TRINITY_DN6526_c0_g1~~TRINITY_DN6526_c0_g1_i2.p1  ORF type:complete len:211 (-),score=34.25 TRINITY_DN6526_c0_g1_i2:101-703(-)